MKLSYYPGCSLEGMAGDYAKSITVVFKHLGIDLIELEDWTCCGSTAAHSLNEMMSVALPARNLAIAEELGLDIICPCAMCFNRLRFSQKMIKKKIFHIPWNVTGDIQVHDMTRFLAEPEIITRIKNRVIRPLNKLKVVCYYGCQMVRLPRIADDIVYENPQTMDRLMKAVGAQVIDWSYKSTCCGASIGIARKDIQGSLTDRILHKARQTGSDAIIVSCPLCQSNLDIIQKDISGKVLPVFYFTELLRLAFEEKSTGKRFRTHFTSPVPLLREKGLLP